MVGIFTLTLRDVDSCRNCFVNHLAVVGREFVVGFVVDAAGEVLAKVTVGLVNGRKNAMYCVKGGITIACDRHNAIAYWAAKSISIGHCKGGGREVGVLAILQIAHMQAAGIHGVKMVVLYKAFYLALKFALATLLASQQDSPVGSDIYLKKIARLDGLALWLWLGTLLCNHFNLWLFNLWFCVVNL